MGLTYYERRHKLVANAPPAAAAPNNQTSHPRAGHHEEERRDDKRPTLPVGSQLGCTHLWFDHAHPAEVLNNRRVLDNYGVVTGGTSPRFEHEVCRPPRKGLPLTTERPFIRFGGGGLCQVHAPMTAKPPSVRPPAASLATASSVVQRPSTAPSKSSQRHSSQCHRLEQTPSVSAAAHAECRSPRRGKHDEGGDEAASSSAAITPPSQLPNVTAVVRALCRQFEHTLERQRVESQRCITRVIRHYEELMRNCSCVKSGNVEHQRQHTHAALESAMASYTQRERGIAAEVRDVDQRVDEILRTLSTSPDGLTQPPVSTGTQTDAARNVIVDDPLTDGGSATLISVTTAESRQRTTTEVPRNTKEICVDLAAATLSASSRRDANPLSSEDGPLSDRDDDEEQMSAPSTSVKAASVFEAVVRKDNVLAVSVPSTPVLVSNPSATSPVCGWTNHTM